MRGPHICAQMQNARTLYVREDAKCADLIYARRCKMRGPYTCAEIQNAQLGYKRRVVEYAVLHEPYLQRNVL